MAKRVGNQVFCKAEFVDFEKIYEFVSEDEYYDFLESYPREIERNVSSVCDPPVISYNDFKLGNFPDSIIASRCAYTEDKDDYFYVAPEDRWWKILKNYKEFFDAVNGS